MKEDILDYLKEQITGIVSGEISIGSMERILDILGIDINDVKTQIIKGE